MFNLADALARGSDALAAWLQGNSGGLLGKEISLKDFAQFVDPKRILDKSPYHRNHMADFGESRGMLRCTGRTSYKRSGSGLRFPPSRPNRVPYINSRGAV